MAPALTEPISPTEKLTTTATSASPSTRSSSRKIESFSIKSNNNIAKQSLQIREKRSCNGNITKLPTPTSALRSTRLRGEIHSKNSLSPSPCADTDLSISEESATRKSLKATSSAQLLCTDNNVNSYKGTDINDEQMGLSTAPTDNKKKISGKNTITSSLDTTEKDTKEDTSTAQLLADLTNEAITAEICLRNQLKDVNLVKVSEGHSSPLQQEVNDIVVLNSATVASSPTTSVEAKEDTAHMEAQSIESKSKSSPVQDSQNIEQQLHFEQSAEITESLLLHKESINENDGAKTVDSRDSSEVALSATRSDVDMETLPPQESPIGSPDSDMEAKKGNPDASKLEILDVQELPPVNTDSTMTASEVEDNLEERLSQLDGTAIDSPPPNQDVDTDTTIKATDNIEASAATPPRTPTHQHTLSQDLQQLQRQLQNTPPTPVSQQVQAHHMQQPNCFTPLSTTSSMNTLGSGNIPQSFIKESDGGTELEDQDIEEVFKVLKGFEGGTTSDLNVCDLNVLFNEVYMKMNETEVNSNSGGGGTAAVGQSHVSVVNPSIQLVKPSELEESQLDIEKRQQQMQRKIDFLMRRLRKQQSRHMCKHTSEEIAGLFEWSSRQSNKGVTHSTVAINSSATETANSELGTALDSNKYFLKVIAARPPASDWKNEIEAPVPATQITALLRKIESVSNAQQLCITPATNLLQLSAPRKSKKALLEAQNAALASSSSMSTPAPTLPEGRAEDVIVSTLDENITDELTQVTGLLQSEMCEVQRAIDSDATESSSGGESADEMVTYNNQQQQTLPITKRAAWRYSRDRAAIASRWSWLLSQISDLEIKIRQHSELHQEIMRSKGPVTCQPENGIKVDVTNVNESDKEELSGSCRTRGFVPAQFRKRKLIQTTNIHTISKKAARPSTIKCGCQWPLHPCALCTGRSDPTAPRDLPDTMMMSDRIALLDSGYHPVLSFKENVNNALHFEAIAKLSEWQQRVMRCQAKNIAKNVWKAEREAVAAAGGGHHSSSKKSGDSAPTKRRYIKKKDRIGNEDKSATSAGSNTPAGKSDAATAKSGPVSSIIEAGNGTATLTSSTSTTPLVANKATVKSAKKQHCLVAGDGILKEPATPLPHSSSNSTNLPITTTTTLMHQTSDCLPKNYDQYNLNPTPSSLISNNHSSSKSNKHRKLSSASVAANSHQYNNYYHNNNHIYNGDSNYAVGHDWVGGGGVMDGGVTAVRSRTSSPTHGSGGSNYHKYERSLDRKNRTSYDIDNIVIPYSVAAATRVEILPYKEIPTPKWRVIEAENDETNNKLETVDIEKRVKPTTNGHFNDNAYLHAIKTLENSTEILETNVDFNDPGLEAKLKQNQEKPKVSETTKCSSPCENNINNNNKVNPENDIKGTVIEGYDGDDDDVIDKEPETKKIKIEPNVIDSQANETSLSEHDISDSYEENISDDAMVLRHERALTEERRKFQTYLKFPWSTRSRANRRIDSRTESSGANTPDPSSPAPHTPCVGGGDQESIPSPSNPSTPLTPLDTIFEVGDNSTSFLGVGALTAACSSSKRQERRRTTSTKRDRELERRSSTPDSKELIPPYEPMQFPLSDEQFEELMRAMPLEHSEESKRFDECYLPGGGSFKHTRNAYGLGNTSKRSSRSSTLCSGDRRIKGSFKNISADDVHENGSDFIYDEEYDDYPKHHLAPNDDEHLTADNNNDRNTDGQDDDAYDDSYDAYTRREKHLRKDDSDGESSETEPFQDDDPNDPEWRGESEDRSRKKV